MEIIPILLKEMDQEAAATRKMFDRVPDDKFGWKPHPKSMTIKELTTHIADIPLWAKMSLTTDGLDFATNPYTPMEIGNTDELKTTFEKSFAEGRKQLSQATEDVLNERWILRSGDHILQNYTRLEAIRVALNQTTHHRAQLGVYLRLLNIPIPGSYGPSADEKGL